MHKMKDSEDNKSILFLQFENCKLNCFFARLCYEKIISGCLQSTIRTAKCFLAFRMERGRGAILATSCTRKLYARFFLLVRIGANFTTHNFMRVLQKYLSIICLLGLVLKDLYFGIFFILYRETLETARNRYCIIEILTVFSNVIIIFCALMFIIMLNMTG